MPKFDFSTLGKKEELKKEEKTELECFEEMQDKLKILESSEQIHFPENINERQLKEVLLASLVAQFEKLHEINEEIKKLEEEIKE